MAKKGTTKKNVTTEAVVSPNVDTAPKETPIVITHEELKVESTSAVRLCNMSITELVAYEKSLRMLCVQYEKIINIDEMEKKFQNTVNRDKFMKLSTLHKRIMNAMENKSLELENYED